MANNDPRLPIFARTLVATPTYVGIPYGTTAQLSYDVDASKFGAAITAQNFPLQLTTYAQMCFTMAEAALIGWIPGGNAVMEDWYSKGIDASMDQWSAVSTTPLVAITAAQKAAYKAQPKIDLTTAVTANARLEKIQTQKWINFYMNNGYEAWAEWRRTGYPVLTPAPGAVNVGGQIPRRQCYPPTEANLNNENYKAVIAAQGPDLLSTKMWWDK